MDLDLAPLPAKFSDGGNVFPLLLELDLDSGVSIMAPPPPPPKNMNPLSVVVPIIGGSCQSGLLPETTFSPAHIISASGFCFLRQNQKIAPATRRPKVVRTRPRAMERPFLAVGVSSMSEEDVGVDAALLLLEVEVAAVLVDADVLVVVWSVVVNLQNE